PGTTPRGIASVVEIEGELVVVIFGGEVDDEASATYFTVKKTEKEKEKDEEKEYGCNAAYGLFIAAALLPFVVRRRK
ncbi:MAG: SYNERG-CTERM sorting domain-containing protein, partial [Synergistaceae bacterium]|nr:SYNERG-CTERM sorting domain-containing protein [Synergistaceae bacterium]